MPLIIFVLVVIVGFVCVKDKMKDPTSGGGNNAWDLRKTNARLESELYYDFIYNKNMPVGDATIQVEQVLTRDGFVPCLSVQLIEDVVNTRFQKPSSPMCFVSSYGYDHFDSYAVQTRRKILAARNLPVNDETVYADFPKSEYDYMRELSLSRRVTNIIKPGTWITHPAYGACQVIKLSDNFFVYECKTLDGRMVNISVKDKDIRYHT